MEKNSQSPALSIEQSFFNQKHSQPGESTGVVVVGLSLGALIRRIGLWKAIRSKIARFRYTRRLWLVREIYLWRVLDERFEKLPDGSLEKRVLKLAHRFPLIGKFLERVEKRLNKRLIANPYRPTLTVSSGVKIRRKRKQKLTVDDLRIANEISANAETFNRLNKSLWQQEKDNLSTVSR